MRLTKSAVILLGLMPLTAMAHPGAGHVMGFWAGLGHPFSGLDHMLAMLAVGLWAAQLKGRALWALPLAFVSAMALGAGLTMAGVSVYLVEPGILLSLLVLGGLVALAAKWSLPMSVGLVGLFAMYHGQAHGMEMPASSDVLFYGLGILMATAALHALGILFAIRVDSLQQQRLTRIAGMAIAVTGLYWGVA